MIREGSGVIILQTVDFSTRHHDSHDLARTAFDCVDDTSMSKVSLEAEQSLEACCPETKCGSLNNERTCLLSMPLH